MLLEPVYEFFPFHRRSPRYASALSSSIKPAMITGFSASPVMPAHAGAFGDAHSGGSISCHSRVGMGRLGQTLLCRYAAPISLSVGVEIRNGRRRVSESDIM